MDIREIDIRRLKPAAYNPRKDLRPGDAEYEKLADSIEHWGLQEPLVWNEATGNLVGGHQRLKVCKARGDKKVQAVVVNMDLAHEKLLNMALNKISAGWDYDRLAQIIQMYSPEDLGITGLSADEIQNLTSAAETAGKELTAASVTQPGGAHLPHIVDEDDAPIYPQGALEAKYEVYLSFPDKASAEAWLAAEGHDERYRSGSHVLILHA